MGDLRPSGDRGRPCRRARRTLALAAVAVLVLVLGLNRTAGAGAADDRGHAGHRPSARAHGRLAVVVPTDTIPPADRPPLDPDPAAPGSEVSSGEDQSDPFLAVFGGRYFLYTSGIPGLPAVNVPVASTTDVSSWGGVTDALPRLPPWAVPGYTWAPDVHRFGTGYMLYFTAMVSGTHPSMECIGDATGTAPDGPFTPTDFPFICQATQGGSIDPRVFTAPNGATWMLWKSDQNIGGAATPTRMWAQRLSGDGQVLLGAPVDILQPDEPWQGTIVEAPDLETVGGQDWLFYSGNWFNQPAYAIGAAHCAGPAGPCGDTSPLPLLASNLQGDGPGEASVFEDASGVWMLYSPTRSTEPEVADAPRPVFITRLGFTAAGPYLAAGGLPPSLDALSPGTLLSPG